MQDVLLNKVRQVFSGDLAIFGGPATDDATAGRLRAEQLAGVLRHSRGIMIANVCNALIFVVAECHTPDTGAAAVWAAMVIALVALVHLRQRQRRDLPKPQTVSERAVRRAVLYAFALGALWSAVPLLFFNSAPIGVQLVVACLCSGMLAGGAFGLGGIPIAALAFTGPIFISSAIAIGRSGDMTYMLVAALLVVYALVLLRTVFSYAIETASRLVAQFDAELRLRRDPLTELPNRLDFTESVEAAFARLARDRRPFTLLWLDLDSFKAINDRLGHTVGDEILVQAADRLRACVGIGDGLARLGGDEFAIIAADAASPEQAAAFARRIVEAFAQPFHIDGQEVMNTISIGLATAPADGDSPRTLLRSADIALYHAKGARGGSFRFFDATDHAFARERRAIEHDLGNALQRGEFRLVYQPILNLDDDRIVGFEALIRWHHPTRGLVGPVDFIPVAESTGMIRRIGDWVVEEACRAASAWPDAIRISVNFSAVQFRDPGIATRVKAAIAASGLAPGRFEVEVTETVLLSDDAAALEILLALSAEGVRVALDDFGTGYSSLSYLRKLPLHRVKIDRSFVQDLQTDLQNAAIVKSVIGLAADLGIETTAEGVETAEQLAFLRAHQCSEAQGYLIGRPVDATEATALLERQPRPAKASTTRASGKRTAKGKPKAHCD